MTAWIGETVTSDAGWDLLCELADVGDRMAGSAGERAGAEATADALADAGARDVRLEAFDIQGWTRGDSSVATPDETLRSLALPRSPAAEATGELADLEYGLPADFESPNLEGRVAMARSDVPEWQDRYVHRREKYYRAVEAGAAAFVYRNHVEGQLAPTGSVGNDEEPIGPIPAVGVSHEVGARLARRWTGEPVTVTVEADVHDATSQNVHAGLGPDTDDRVLVCSHVDGHDVAEGALDNGAGTAMVVELARALAAREAELDTRVEFVAFGAEEVGLVGSTHYADRTDRDAVVAVLNNDGVVRGRTLDLVTNGFDALADAARRAADRFGHPLTATPTLSPHSDHWPLTARGVPGIHATSETPDLGRGWGHTAADTLDKVDRRNLTEQGVLLTELAVELADADVEIPHREPADIEAQLEAEDEAAGLRVAGDWPF
ncbi:MAG: M20/M25/M40 family metallo-hydrolase [Halobacteriales archaeon]